MKIKLVGWIEPKDLNELYEIAKIVGVGRRVQQLSRIFRAQKEVQTDEK